MKYSVVTPVHHQFHALSGAFGVNEQGYKDQALRNKEIFVPKECRESACKTPSWFGKYDVEMADDEKSNVKQNRPQKQLKLSAFRSKKSKNETDTQVKNDEK
jgi:hypothetical protein